jgi:4-hydroxy-3-methylbut-2-en-1-yl diphosphate synthase IspG/GcpE
MDFKSNLLIFTEETKMYEDFMKMAQESLKPVMKLAENNTALAVKLMQTQAATTAEMMQSNLSHVQALVETKDLNVAVEMQQKYVETLNEKLATVAKDNAAVIEAAVTEAGKIFEGSLADVQAQAKKAAQNIEKEIAKAGKKAA